MQTIYMSPSMFKAQSERLVYLQRERTKEIADALELARSHGDLSENSEYKSAKEDQELLMKEIEMLEEQLGRTTVVKNGSKDGSVFIGSKVKVYFVADKDEEEFEICGIFETNPRENRISNESPIGKALFGKKKGEKVTVVTPDGSFAVEIKEVK